MEIFQKAHQISLELFSKSIKDPGHQHHYSFLFIRNKLISVGTNDYQLNKKALYFANRYNIPQKKSWPTLHSEIDAISRLWGRHNVDKKLRLVNVRLLKGGRLANSKPCKDCQEVLDALGLTDIFWSIEDGFSS